MTRVFFSADFLNNDTLKTFSVDISLSSHLSFKHFELKYEPTKRVT